MAVDLFTEQSHDFISTLFLLLSMPTFVITHYFIKAPFGRHVQGGEKYRWWYGPSFDARLSWFIFECPNLVWSWYCFCYLRDPDVIDTSAMMQLHQLSTNAILLFLFTIHYINRSIVYPLRMNRSSHRVPLVVTFSACIVTIMNGYIQSFYLVRVRKLAPLSFPPLSWTDIQCWLGIVLFFLGMIVNIKSDTVLRNLRRRNKGGAKAYYIPQSPLFTYISCPNFFGEILEWFGFTVASNFAFPAVAFFIYTSSNLIPRGIAHHKWYQNKFDDYPKERKWAVIPFLV